LAEIWRQQPTLRGRFPALTSGQIDQFLLSKPYFDPAGLIVALRDGLPVGFIHAGFGPSDDEQSLSRETGTIYMLMLAEGQRDTALADELVGQAEAYLRAAGALVLYAGGIRPLNAFYLGLYGGSELPGVLAGDTLFAEACRRNGYREIDRVVILERDLASFRRPVTRSQRQLGRELTLLEETSPRSPSWWAACTTGAFETSQYRVTPVQDGASVGEVAFWEIEPLSISWGATTAGMVDLQVSGERRRKGIATFLLSEAFTRLTARGVARVQAQTMQMNDPAIALYRQLGFQQVDEGLVFRKDA
jgi:ribosomal protein S18 acetylase RimI-like enzyme